MITRTFSANGTQTVAIETPGTYFFEVGATGGTSFGGGTLTVTQAGLNLFTPLTAAARTTAFCYGGTAVSMVLSGSTNPDLDVKIMKT